MLSQDELDAVHRAHNFTIPALGELVTSPMTRITYTIGKQFNSGAHGLVFFCKDQWDDDLVAKILKPEGVAFADLETRAFDELAAQFMAKSPHIVHVHDAFIYKGAFYIISEYCGQSVRELIERQLVPYGWFDPIVKAVLHALYYMHNQQLAHCDIHAGNVFLKFQDDAIVPDGINSASIFKLGDFGLTRPIEIMDPCGTFLNCLRPPEAIDPEKFGILDHRADIYQAGLLFLNILLGRELEFSMEDILEGRPRQLAESLPKAESKLIATMLRRHSEARPASALDAWLEFKQNTQYQ